ncbi:LytR/AlgR family response regulator transcription factor [Paenibacillus sp. NPDC056579]|uniref:LytR/AlgR family response regulator transcription factor n=1 Tax=Paenibacillus sp. NPDC056579 TaxID=3345871 RepID=UPI0036CD3155
MGWKIVIADDEAPAREELSFLVGNMSEVETVVVATGGMDAIKKVRETKPDLLFLDMDMPDLNGLQVAELVGELDPRVKVVFSTAYDQYAVNAFKLRAFHYILKPYDDEDVEAVFRELRQVSQKESGGGGDTGALLREQERQGQPQPQTACVKLALELEDGIKYVSPKDIVYISKEGKHVQVHTWDQAYEVAYTLQDLEGKLGPYGLFRCHKSYLVQLESIAEMKSWVNGAYNLVMNDTVHSKVPVSRNYVKELRLKLEI